MFFSREQVNKGRKIVNSGIIILICLLIVNFTINIVSYGFRDLIKQVIITGLILINIFLYYKGNKLAIKIIMFLLSIVYIFIFCLLPIYLILGLLHMLNVLDAFGGALFLIIPTIIIIAVSVLMYKTEFYDNVLAKKYIPAALPDIVI